MNTLITAIAHTAHRIRHRASRVIARLTRKASIKLAVTISLPPFLKIAFDYKADIGTAADETTSRRAIRRTA